MKKSVNFIFYVLLITAICPEQNWNRLSKQIRKKQETIMSLYIRKEDEGIDVVRKQLCTYHICRKRLDILRSLQIKNQADTIYILETEPNILSYNLESTIFTKKEILSYNCQSSNVGNCKLYKTDSLVITNKPLYSKHMLKLAIQWKLEK